MKPANHAPVYACMYPELATIAREHGYALAAHGSLARDFDLVCIPWGENPSDPEKVIDAMCAAFSIKRIDVLTDMPHGRKCQTISLSWGECFIDLSFMPIILEQEANTAAEVLREVLAALEFYANGEHGAALCVSASWEVEHARILAEGYVRVGRDSDGSRYYVEHGGRAKAAAAKLRALLEDNES